MADLPSTQQPSAPLVYRPISRLALAGVVLSCLFAGLVVSSTLVALVQGLPVFLPSFTLGLALAGAVLCYVAQLRIRNAEGTLAGIALARWGLWLSVLLGVTYFVYVKVTGLALAKQANDFLMVKSDEDTGFFPRLRNAGKNRVDLYQAFLLSLPTTSRGGSKAANEQAMLDRYDQPGRDGDPGNISSFSKRPLVLALMRNADSIQIEPLGGMEWKYEGNSYHVQRNYRFTTKEVVFETHLLVQSTEGTGEGEQRKWFVNMNRVGTFKPKPTPYGEKLLALRYYSKVFLEKWRTDLIEGTPTPQYKETDTDWAKILPKQELRREHVQTMLGEIFRAERKVPFQTAFTTDDFFAEWSMVDGRIQILHPMRMILPAGDIYPNYNLELEFVVATKDPVDLTASISHLIPWEIRAIRVLRAAPAPKVQGPT